MKNLTRITFDPKIMGGKPCLRNLNVTVGMIMRLLAAGYSNAAILKEHQLLEEDDINEALTYSALVVEGIEYHPHLNFF